MVVNILLNVLKPAAGVQLHLSRHETTDVLLLQTFTCLCCLRVCVCVCVFICVPRQKRLSVKEPERGF